jgi:dihydrofolate reductase
MERKLVLYIAMSVDGFIAKKDDNIDFLSVVDIAGEDYGHTDFLNRVDTVIWGRRTFDKVLSFGGELPYSDKQVYVISKTRTGNHGCIEYKSDPAALVKDLKKQEGKDIYCDGGAEIVSELLKDHLIDRIIVSVIPHLLGTGIRLFKDGLPGHRARLLRCATFPSGLVQLWYDIDIND